MEFWEAKVRRAYRLIAVLVFIISFFCTGCDTGTQRTTTSAGDSPASPVTSDKTGQQAGEHLVIHYLDVGQADSTLVQLPGGRVMLVDAGNNEDGQAVVAYIKRQGIRRIDYVVGTHPHEDHVGGLDDVIRAFPVGRVYLPRVTTTTRTFEDVLLAIKASGLKITPAAAGKVIIKEERLELNFVAPCGSGYENLNDYSAVIRIEYGDNAFLLTGDAGEESERDMLASGVDLRAEVLKVGHHGSRYSTTPAFLKQVAPRYAVVSVGIDNDYGHPHRETMTLLAAAKVRVYRTDHDGTVIITSDGRNIRVNVRAAPPAPAGG